MSAITLGENALNAINAKCIKFKENLEEPSLRLLPLFKMISLPKNTKSKKKQKVSIRTDSFFNIYLSIYLIRLLFNLVVICIYPLTRLVLLSVKI